MIGLGEVLESLFMVPIYLPVWCIDLAQYFRTPVVQCAGVFVLVYCCIVLDGGLEV